MMNTLESDKQYGCFNSNQFKESAVVKSSQRNKFKKNDDNNFKNP